MWGYTLISELELDASGSYVASPELLSRIVSELQCGLPLSDRPYREVANRLSISEKQLMNLLRGMLRDGSIRRIGVVPNHYALGYTHNLMTVWDVDDLHAERLGQKVGELCFVSHCYLRPRANAWPYNLFAMVHGKTQTEVDIQKQQICELLGDTCTDYSSLRSTKILKKTGLRI